MTQRYVRGTIAAAGLTFALLVAPAIAGCGDASLPTGTAITPSPTVAFTPVPSEPALSTEVGPTEPPAEPSETPVRTSATVEQTASPGPESPGGGVVLESSAFRGSRIPPKYTCDGNDVSPPLDWRLGSTDEVSEFAIVVTDPDAGGFVHWVVARIPGTDTALLEGAGDPDAGNGLLQGKNSFGSSGYRGPCPPAGTTHHYHFALYSFATAPDLSDSPTADEVIRAGGSPVLTLDAIYGH